MPGRIRNTLDNTNDLVLLIKELVRNTEDGIELSLVNTGEGTVLQFLSGEIKELPIKIKVKL